MADARTKRVREVMDSIRVVLFKDWDPLGINADAELGDEYDSCIASIYRLLIKRASARDIVNCLHKLESELGMPAKSKEHLLPIAHKLLALNVKVEPNAA